MKIVAEFNPLSHQALLSSEDIYIHTSVRQNVLK